MRRNAIALMLLVAAAATQVGCSSEFWGGGAAGAVGAAAGYEVASKRQLDQLTRDYEAGKMDAREYEIRKSQIQKGSLIY